MSKILLMLLVAIMGSSVLADNRKVINKFSSLREGRQNEETDGSLEETAGKCIQMQVIILLILNAQI